MGCAIRPRRAGALTAAGIDYAGYLPNFRAPEAFAAARMTVHVPRRPYARMLPGIPTIRMFEALACGIPLASAPWDDCENLFTPGEDYLVARDGGEMRRHLAALRADPALRAHLAERGRATVVARHSCAHRVDELLAHLPHAGPRSGRTRNAGRIMTPLSIAFFGSSLVSAYWNGAATYYRGILRALAANGHRITFYEPDAYDRQKHRDIPDPDWARVVVYPAEGEAGVERALDEARSADLIVKASGVGVFDELLEARVPAIRRPGAIAAFWDVDAPATLDRIAADRADPFRPLIPDYDIILTYGGGPPVVSAYQRFGARRCVPIYNGLDPSTHHPAAPEPRFACDLGLVANRLPDRERRIDEFFIEVAADLPGPPFSARRQWLGRQEAAGQYRQARPPLHARPQRLQRFGAGGAERQPRQHGRLWVQPGDAGVRGGRRGRLRHHRRLGGDRRVL